MNLTIITNGNFQIGYGHISRTLIIADFFNYKGHKVNFLLDTSCIFTDRINSGNYKVECIDFNDSEQVNNYLNQYSPDIIIIDCIESNYDILSYLTDSSSYLVSITLFFFDLSKRYEQLSFFPVFSHNEIIKIENKLRIYKGKDYIIFNKKFRALPKKRFNPNAKDVLITMGGTDPFNITYKVFNSIKECHKYNFTILLSDQNFYYQELKKISKNTDHLHVINFTSDMPELMHKSDLLILNGGLTRYEACLTKTPFIAISIHDIQFKITKEITDLGVGINLGIYNEISELEIYSAIENVMSNDQKRLSMFEGMNDLLDFDGAERIYNKVIHNYIEFNEKNNKVC